MHMRIPFPLSKRVSGSMTVEAALVLPLFIFSMVLIGYMGVLMSEEEQVQMAMVRVAREASAGYGATEGSAYKKSGLLSRETGFIFKRQ